MKIKIRSIEDQVKIFKLGGFLKNSLMNYQNFNIIKGEMSFVGPRPLLIEYLNLYSKGTTP